MPYRTLLLTTLLGLTLAGCADNLAGGGPRGGYGAWDDGPYDWTDNGRCDDPNYNISGFGDAWPGTDEYDCRRYGGGLRGGVIGPYYGWYGAPDRAWEWQRQREFEIRRRLEEQRRDRERAERHDHDRDGDRDRDRRRDWSQRPGGDPIDRAHRDLDEATRRQLFEQRRQQREQARQNGGQPDDGQHRGWDGRRGPDRPAPSGPPSSAPPAADGEQHHPNLPPPPPPSAGEQHHPRLDMGERRQEN